MKLLAQRETQKLEHSRSSNDLKSPPPRDPLGKSKLAGTSEDSPPARPPIGRLRRRSTLNWTGASPAVRQKKLEDVTGGRLADTWFSLHCQGVEEPVYVSEAVEKAMNPSFRFFDLDACGPSVTRLDEVTVKFWARSENMKDYRLLVEVNLHLGSLQFIGKSVCKYTSLERQALKCDSSRTFIIPYRRIVSSFTSQMVYIQASRICRQKNHHPKISNHHGLTPMIFSQRRLLMLCCACQILTIVFKMPWRHGRRSHLKSIPSYEKTETP